MSTGRRFSVGEMSFRVAKSVKILNQVFSAALRENIRFRRIGKRNKRDDRPEDARRNSENIQLTHLF